MEPDIGSTEMSITREERTELHHLVRAALGDRLADLLMAGLDTADLAAMEERLTLRIENSRLELRGEMADLRGELRGEMADLRGEFRELHGEFGELRGEMAVGFAARRSEMADRSRSTFIAVFTANAAVAGLVLAALQIVS